MHSFKKIIRLIICMALLFLILKGVDIALYPCTFMRNDIHTVTTEQRDVIIMGTSNGKMGLDPDAMLEGTGMTGHNLCVGGEYPVDCYYMMQLILEKQKPKTLIFELDPGYFTTEKEEGNNYLLFYHEFPMSKAKLSYFADTMMDCDFRVAMFPCYEYSLEYELSKVKDTLYQKLHHNYDVSYLKGTAQEYHENGFIERYPVAAADFKPYQPEVFTPEAVCDSNMEYMDKLIALCKENDVEFIAATMPLPATTLTENWDSFVTADRYFTDYFKEKEVKYYDFNVAYYTSHSHSVECFTDYDGHMNGESAREFSRVFGELLFGK